MKKKVSLFLCLLAIVFSFTACGNDSQEDYDKESMEQVAEFMISYCSTADEETFEQWDDMTEFAVNLQLTQAGITMEAEDFLSVLESWQAGVEECGAYAGHDDYSYTITNGTIEMTASAQFETRDGKITFGFDQNTQRLESLTISADMSTGEILQKAGLNTLLGMGTVFVVLIIIALIISLLGLIPKLQGAMKKKPARQAAQTEAPSKDEETETVEATDDTELIAVIAAAIAAAEETTTDGFIVRSIRRRQTKNKR